MFLTSGGVVVGVGEVRSGGLAALVLAMLPGLLKRSPRRSDEPLPQVAAF